MRTGWAPCFSENYSFIGLIIHQRFDKKRSISPGHMSKGCNREEVGSRKIRRGRLSYIIIPGGHCQNISKGKGFRRFLRQMTSFVWSLVHFPLLWIRLFPFKLRSKIRNAILGTEQKLQTKELEIEEKRNFQSCLRSPGFRISFLPLGFLLSCLLILPWMLLSKTPRGRSFLIRICRLQKWLKMLSRFIPQST